MFSSCGKADQFGRDMAVYVGLTVVNHLCLVIALVYCLIVTPCSLLSSLYERKLPVDGNFASTTCGHSSRFAVCRSRTCTLVASVQKRLAFAILTENWSEDGDMYVEE